MNIRAPRFVALGVLAVMTALVASLAITPVPAAAQAQDTQAWLHVRVTETGEEGEPRENVSVNLPLGAVEAFLAMAPVNMIEEHQQQLAEHGVSVSALRAMWTELKEVGDTEFVTVESADDTVRVARTGDQIQVRVEETQESGDTESVLVDLPIAVVDALLSGDGDTLNIEAAIRALSGLRGDIVRVSEPDTQVRVWIDERAQQ